LISEKAFVPAAGLKMPTYRLTPGFILNIEARV
jgi:hypothetical protein